MNVYVCKAFRGSKLVSVRYIQAYTPQLALYEFRGDMDLDMIDRVYFDVRQVD